MANSTSTWRYAYSQSGLASPPTFNYGIASGEDWSVGSVVAWNDAGTLLDPTDDSSDVLGLSLDTVVSGAATGVETALCTVIPFMHDLVYAVKNAGTLTDTPAVTDIGTLAVLDLDTAVWGILVDTATAANTKTFRIVDIDVNRAEWYVVVAPEETTDVFQWIDAEVS